MRVWNHETESIDLEVSPVSDEHTTHETSLDGTRRRLRGSIIMERGTKTGRSRDRLGVRLDFPVDRLNRRQRREAV